MNLAVNMREGGQRLAGNFWQTVALDHEAAKGLYWGYKGITENRMETTTGIGYTYTYFIYCDETN